MAISTIYPNGVNEVVVPATQSIAISNFGGGIASIYYLIVNANRPAAYQLQQTLDNSSVVLGAFADGMTIKIEAGQSVVRYDVGASPDTGIGDADTLGGELPSYYAADSLVAHLAGAESFTDIKTFAAQAVFTNANNQIHIDSANNAEIQLDAGLASSVSQIKAMVAGSNKGTIKYNHNATAASESLVFNVGGITNVVMSINGDGTVEISDDGGTTLYVVYHEGTSSASDTFTTADAKTVTVVNGLITSIV